MRPAARGPTVTRPSDPVEAAREEVGGRPSIRRQLVIMLAVSIAPALAFAAPFAWHSYQQATERAERQFIGQARYEVRRQRDAMVAAHGALTALSVSPSLQSLGGEACDAALAAFERRFPLLPLAVAMDPSGRVRCASDPAAIGMEFGSGEGYGSFLAEPRFRIDHEPIGAVTGVSVLVMTLPLQADDGSLRGILAASMAEEAIWRLSEHDSAPGAPPLRHALIDSNGALLTAESQDVAAPWLPEAGALVLRRADSLQSFSGVAANGEPMAYAAIPLAEAPFWLISGVERDRLYAGLLARAAFPIATPMIVLLIALAVVYFGLDRLVIRHLIYLSRMARAYGSGRLDLAPRQTASASREIALLGEELHAMAANLKERGDALRQAARTNEKLLVEVLHRVNNNLQTITGLLNHETRRVDGVDGRAALARMQARVRSIAAVQSLLYGAEGPGEVPLDALLREIARSVAEEREAEGAIELALVPAADAADRAMTLALFVNELLIGALEARRDPDARAAAVRLTLEAEPPRGGYRVTVSVEAADHPAPTGADSVLLPALARRLRARIDRRCEGDVHAVAISVPDRSTAAA